MKSITITRDEFIKAVEQANKKFGEVGAKREDRNEVTEIMMQLQNTVFGCILADVLFNEKEDM